MKKPIKPLFNLTQLLFISIFFFSNGNFAQSNNWVSPATSNEIVNPLKGNEEAIKKGKATYNRLCSICHGTFGKGDGLAGASLNPRPADFTSSVFKAQSDGAIYWKINTGRPPMASYQNLLTEDEKWELINYIRTLK